MGWHCCRMRLLLMPSRSIYLWCREGAGQEAVMEDEEVLSFISQQARRAKCVFSVCTGALVLGAAGLLMGRKATCYWPAFGLLKYFGAVPTNQRVVIDGNLVTAAGLTAGIDGALRVAAMLRGDAAAQGDSACAAICPGTAV